MIRDVINTNKPRVAYIGGCPKSKNLGDVALFKAYKKIFDLNDHLVWYPGGRAVYYPSRCGFFSDVGILAGGTLINRWSAPLECTKLFKKLIVFGTGVAQKGFWEDVGTNIDNPNKWNQFLKKCNYIGVRGPLSLKELMNNGVRADIIGDPVLTFAIDEPIFQQYIFDKKIGLNIGWDTFAQWGESKAILNEYSRFVDMARLKGWEITWYVVCPSDLEMTRKIAKESNSINNIVCNYDDPEGYIHQVQKQSVFLGMRLHSVVLATCAYVPSIMVEYRPKCRDFMLSIDCENSIIRSDNIDAQGLLDLVEYKYNNRFEESRLLFKSVYCIKTKQLEKAKELKSSLGF